MLWFMALGNNQKFQVEIKAKDGMTARTIQNLIILLAFLPPGDPLEFVIDFNIFPMVALTLDDA